MCAEAETRIQTLSAADALKLAEAGEATLIDIRDIRELARDGAIDGALHAPRDMLEFWIDPESPYHKPALLAPKKHVLFCAGGMRSALAADRLREMGLEGVAHVRGGYRALIEAGAPRKS